MYFSIFYLPSQQHSGREKIRSKDTTEKERLSWGRECKQETQFSQETALTNSQEGSDKVQYWKCLRPSLRPAASPQRRGNDREVPHSTEVGH